MLKLINAIIFSIIAKEINYQVKIIFTMSSGGIFKHILCLVLYLRLLLDTQVFTDSSIRELYLPPNVG